jgi:ribosomal protein S18 acetylase RimI-like enzyme
MNFISFQSYQISDYTLIIEKLKDELGERFPHSIRSWCGLETRPYPLVNWNLYLASDVQGGSILGLYSYYQQPGDPPEKFWIGWLGVLPEYRRQGLATQFLAKVIHSVKVYRGEELWVHTDRSNIAAIQLYMQAGMSYWGEFNKLNIRQASADRDSAVLWMPLSHSDSG